MRPILIVLYSLVAAGACARAQTPAAEQDAPAIKIKTLDAVNRHDTMDLGVAFDSILASSHPEDLTDSNITIISTPSGSRIVPARIHQTTDTDVEIALRAPPEADDNSIEVCFKTLHFLKLDDPKTYTSSGKPVCATSKIMTQAEARNLADQLNSAANKAKADKTSSEKNIFASGFVTTGGASDTQGGADISLNNSVSGLPGANAFLQIQKTSLNNGDPRHFEAGLSWRHITSFDPKLDRKIVNDLKRYEQAGTEAVRADLGKAINADAAKYGVWLGALEDFAIKLEGDPTHFKAVNTVGDGDLRILTRTLKLFGSTNGYFRARPLVIGFEGGRSLGQGDPTIATTGGVTSTTTPTVSWIARGKAGADFTLFYDDEKAKGPLKRFEIDAGGIERYLIFKEVGYSSITTLDSVARKGSRPYFQSDVKLFFAEDGKSRYGIRMAYTRGSLPPVFADVKSFQFGFVYETTDDKAK